MQYIIDKYNTTSELENEIQVAKKSLKSMEDQLKKLEVDLKATMGEVVVHFWKAETGKDIIEAARLQIAYQKALLKALIKKRDIVDK